MLDIAGNNIEQFQPVPLRFGSSLKSRLAFRLRCVADLQLGTIWTFLGPQLKNLRGSLLDVGCGEMPYRGFLPQELKYVGIDVPEASAFQMQGNEDVISFDGRYIPFPDATFDTVLCTEVLEHSPQPSALIAEIERVLKPGGTLVATVPFSARVHYAPYDFYRFSRYALQGVLKDFEQVKIDERGNDIAVIANKLIVVALGLIRPSGFRLLRCIFLLPLLALSLVFLLMAHLTMALGVGSKDDCLGYGIVAVKR